MTGSPTSLFDESQSSYWGARHLTRGGTFTVKFTFAIENVDGFEWKFKVSECCGGRSLQARINGVWTTVVNGSSGGNVRTNSATLSQPVTIDGIRMVYTGSSSSGVTFNNYDISLFQEGVKIDVEAEAGA